ncbi:MAG TPA: hypothetical protein VMU18_12785 [Rhodoblastus sp.]|nr:hypothetical protein [Rhodoblastus sp.]
MSMAALGYQLGLKGKTQHVLALILMVMRTMVIVDILDLALAPFGPMSRSMTGAAKVFAPA